MSSPAARRSPDFTSPMSGDGGADGELVQGFTAEQDERR